MEDLFQVKNTLIEKIDALLEKISKIDDERYIINRDQAYLIISNLKSVINICDEKFLVKNVREVITSNVANIDSYATNSQISSSSVQTYLYSIIQAISYLNNASGKQSLQGYQQAVNKNIRLLEEDVLSSKNKVDELEKEIAKKASELELAEKDFLKYIEDNRSSHETKLLELNNKYEEFSKEVFEEQRKIKNTHDEQITKTNEEISKIKTDLLEKTSKALTEFEKVREDKLDKLTISVSDKMQETENKIKSLMDSATDKIGKVASSTFSTSYKEYSDKAKCSSTIWYAGTILSMLALVVLSIFWFVITKYSNGDYIALIARICATVGVAVISRYCALQASKNKVIETKLRKIQLQMKTFDAFVATLDKVEQDKLKIELTKKVIEQGDWLSHDKDEVDIINEYHKILSKINKNTNNN